MHSSFTHSLRVKMTATSRGFLAAARLFELIYMFYDVIAVACKALSDVWHGTLYTHSI